MTLAKQMDRRRWLLMLALVAGGGLAGALAMVAVQVQGDRREAEALLLRLQASTLQRITAARVISQSLAAAVAIQPELSTDAFYRFSELALAGQRDVSALQLSPGGLIAAQYPHATGPHVGLNLLTSPTNAAASARAIQMRSSVVQGPFPLVQGGEGLVIRTPVFSDRGQTFWGFVGVLFDWEGLVSSLRNDAGAEGFALDLQLRDSTGETHSTIRSGDRTNPRSATQMTALPGGELTLLALRRQPTACQQNRRALMALAGGGVAGLLGLQLVRLPRFQMPSQSGPGTGPTP